VEYLSKIGKISISFLALLALIFAFYSSSVEANTRFPDVKTSREEILYLANKGIINGYDGGKFGPNDPIKRVHAVQMIIRELGVKTGDAPNPNFSDVKPGSYGYADIAKAKQLGIISGKGEGKFDPNGTLTRGEMAKIVVEAYNLKSNYGKSFKDVSVKHFSNPYVQTLVAHNITQGYPDGTFRPDVKMTREHFALFMARQLNDQFRGYQLSAEEFKNSASKFTQSVVMINLYDEEGDLVTQGSGFITSNNLIATIFENISGGVKAEAVVEKTGETFLLEGVVGYDDIFDVALLKPVKKIGLPSLPLADFSTIDLEDRVLAIGFLDRKTRAYSYGEVTDLLEGDTEFGYLKVIENSGDYDSDFYGGPLLNDQGYVIGLNSFDLFGYYYAFSSDYLNDLLAPYREMKFSEIAVEDFSEMPEIDYEDDPDGGDDGDDPDWGIDFPDDGEITPIDLEDIPGVKTVFNDLLIDVVHDEELPVIYGITEDGNVVAINYETQQVNSLSYDYRAESIFYKNGNLFITLLKGMHNSYWREADQEGAIAIVDAKTFITKKIVDIALDPYDIVADDTYFYVSSGSGQWTSINSYNIETGEHISTGYIRQRSSIEIHPNGKSIYAINSDSSPRNFQVFTIDGGQIGDSYNSPDGPDYLLYEWMKISYDGKYIFNPSGNVFKATSLQSTNMRYVTNIGTMFYDVTFNESNTEFYVSAGDLLYVFDYESFTPTKTYSLSGDGYYLFTHKGKVITVGEEETNKAGVYKTFIQTSDLTK
jgi:serine protease Do